MRRPSSLRGGTTRCARTRKRHSGPPSKSWSGCGWLTLSATRSSDTAARHPRPARPRDASVFAGGAPRSDAREGCGQAGDLAPRAEDRAAARTTARVVRGHDVEIAQVVAAEAQARDHAGGHVDPALGPAVREEALRAASPVARDPHAALDIHGETVGPFGRDGRQRRRATARIERMPEHARARGVAVVDARAVRREADAVGEQHAAVELGALPLAVDAPALAGDALALDAEGIGLHRAGVDAALRVGEEIVEAGRVVAHEED